MVVRMRSNRSHTRNRRSHHALKEPTLSTCKNCGGFYRPHHMCLECGHYKGRQVLDITADKKKREERMNAKREIIGSNIQGENALSAPENDIPSNQDVVEDSKIADKKTNARARKAKAAEVAQKQEPSAPHTTKDQI